jgi:hypothetical protein
VDYQGQYLAGAIGRVCLREDVAMTDREQDREAFEKWIQKRHGVSLERWHDTGKYRYDDTNRWWECWQAAAAAATQAQADTATTRLLAEFQIKWAEERNRALELEAKLAAAEADIERWRERWFKLADRYDAIDAAREGK